MSDIEKFEPLFSGENDWATTIRNWSKQGVLLETRIIDGGKIICQQGWNLQETPYHPVISTSNPFLEACEEYARYLYLREQLDLNGVRCGANLVDEERTRHILEGEPIVRSVHNKGFDEDSSPYSTVRGWSGGHANPDAAKYGKTQIPEFWTGDRFMYEVSDIISDVNSKWRLQVSADDEDTPERYVCVEERYGVPIRVVVERVDDELKCVTAFPDYGAFPLDDRMSDSFEQR